MLREITLKTFPNSFAISGVCLGNNACESGCHMFYFTGSAENVTT